MEGLQHRIFKFLASVKLAVVVIIAIGTITAIGTFVESAYNADTAQELVYRSPYMYAAMILLCINLIAVMVDRWPWKRRHMGFILAHIGIITLLLGAYITQKFGIDGTMRIPVHQSARYISLPQVTDLVAYATFDGQNVTADPVYSRRVDFLRDPPSTRDPLVAELEKNVKLTVTGFMPYALEQDSEAASKNPNDPPAIRFQLNNGRVDVAQWVSITQLGENGVINLGPAQVVLTQDLHYKPSGHNEIVVVSEPKGKLAYDIYSSTKQKLHSGMIHPGDVINTGWMGLQFRLIEYLPHSTDDVKYVREARPDPRTISAIKINFEGHSYWLGLNSMIKLFTNSAAYILTYQNRMVDSGIKIYLKKFIRGTYQGTNDASSYKSFVSVSGLGDVAIYMNHPLKYKGFTFYQASFEQNSHGNVKATVLSVNRDPGRPLKYIGSILIVLGTITMFYFKRLTARRNSKKAAAAAGTT